MCVEYTIRNSVSFLPILYIEKFLVWSKEEDGVVSDSLEVHVFFNMVALTCA